MKHFGRPKKLSKLVRVHVLKRHLPKTCDRLRMHYTTDWRFHHEKEKPSDTADVALSRCRHRCRRCHCRCAAAKLPPTLRCCAAASAPASVCYVLEYFGILGAYLESNFAKHF